MKKAKLILDKDYSIGYVDKRLYGSFIEHLGRAVYSGIYEPGHPEADEQGFRKDIIELVKQLNVPIIRYPGGNFVSGYNWTDGIGPIKERPTRLDLAWQSIETNEVGIDEFADWCRKANSKVMAAVNLGTGSPQDAGYMLEYCNHPGGTYWSDLRKKNGRPDPHNIKVWCLGNEMDGPWQIGHLSAEDYGKKALETAKIMKWIDPSIELVACGSSGANMPTYPEWDRIVLEYLYDHVDYISLHRYYETDENTDIADFLASFSDMDRFIKTIAATADYVKAKKRSNKTLMLSFDEWNVWYIKKVKLYPWEIAPAILEDIYTLLDALVFGGLMCTLVNNCDRVKMACLAQLVNVIAPIFTQKGGPAIKQSIFYPFQLMSAYARGLAIKPIISCPEIETKVHGVVPLIQTAAIYNETDEIISIFALNCDQLEGVELSIDLRSFGKVEVVEHIVLDGPDILVSNSFDEPEKTKPRVIETNYYGSEFKIALPKLSWNMIKIKRMHK